MFLGIVLMLVLGLVGAYMWANSIWNRVEKVALEDSLSDGGVGNGTNYLIVGSDSREGLTEGDPGFAGAEAPGGQRSDTLIVLHVGGDGARMLSIPRDLYVPIADTGGSQKINAAYNGGPPRLVRTITAYLDIPIHRYIEIDFSSFGGLVDALGGVTIDFPNPAFDSQSGLNVPQAGPVELDGEQALAYVRSRHYTEVINGEQREDPTADLGRIERQQTFLRALFEDLGKTKSPLALADVASSMADGLRVDDDMTLFNAMGLVWSLRNGISPEPLVLPVTADRNESGAVLLLNEEEAQATLDQVR